jgi:hypothetical protein
MTDSKLSGGKHYLNMILFFPHAQICYCPSEIFILYSNLGGFISSLQNTILSTSWSTDINSFLRVHF